VPGEAEVAFGAVFARMLAVRHEFLHGGQVAVEDHGADQLDLDLGAFDGDFLEIAFADGALIPPVTRPRRGSLSKAKAIPPS